MSRRSAKGPLRARPLLRLFALLTGLVTVAVPADAEDEARSPSPSFRALLPRLEYGDELRLHFLDGSRWEGTLVHMDGQEIQVQGRSGPPPARVAYEDLARVERRTDGRPLEGLAVGLGVGALTGLAVTTVYASSSDNEFAGLAVIFFVPMGMLIGGATGVAIGSVPGWESVPLYLEDLDAAGLSPAQLALLRGELPQGTRLRLEFLDGQRHEVELISSGPDSLRVLGPRAGAQPVAFGYDELRGVEYWRVETERRSSTAAVLGGSALGLAGGLAIGWNQESNGSKVSYAMAGTVLGGLVGGLLGSRSVESSEWEKLFVVPAEGGAVIGYHTRF